MHIISVGIIVGVWLLIVLVFVADVSVEPSQLQAQEPLNIQKDLPYFVNKFTDGDITCYYKTGRVGGISCLK